MKHLLTLTLPVGIITESYSSFWMSFQKFKSKILYSIQEKRVENKRKQQRKKHLTIVHMNVEICGNIIKHSDRGSSFTLRNQSLNGTICARTHTRTHTAAHLRIQRSTLAWPYPRRNQYALCCLLRYRLPNNNQWNGPAVLASVWNDVSELSC